VIAVAALDHGGRGERQRGEGIIGTGATVPIMLEVLIGPQTAHFGDGGFIAATVTARVDAIENIVITGASQGRPRGVR